VAGDAVPKSLRGERQEENLIGAAVKTSLPGRNRGLRRCSGNPFTVSVAPREADPSNATCAEMLALMRSFGLRRIYNEYCEIFAGA